MEAARDTLRFTLFTFLSRNLSIFSREILWELDSIIGNYVSWGIFTEMKQSIISPKTFQLLAQTDTALSVARHTDTKIKSDQEDRKTLLPNTLPTLWSWFLGLCENICSLTSAPGPELCAQTTFPCHFSCSHHTTEAKPKQLHTPCWVIPTLRPAFLLGSSCVVR